MQMQKKLQKNQNQSYRSVMKTLLPKQQTWGRSKHKRRDERFLSLAQIDKLCHELKWNMLNKACALGFLLAEIRIQKPYWCLDLLISWYMAEPSPESLQ